MSTTARFGAIPVDPRASASRLFTVVSDRTAQQGAQGPCENGAGAIQTADDETYGQGMRQLAGGVCVVTVGRGGAREGLTVTSVVSLSADPPTLLFCIQRSSSGYGAVASCDAFAVNVLAADQREFADRFSGPGGLRGADRDNGGEWLELPSGLCGLSGAAAIFDCEVDERLERATHAMVIGRVRHVLVGDGGGALLYWRAAYDQVGWRRDEIARAIGLSPRGAE
jgi:flavin reductase (DIM6/NTAB) family NADH-FMN oxidoreductase RutF